MSASAGFLIAIAIITFGGAGIAAFLVWLYYRDTHSEGADRLPPSD